MKEKEKQLKGFTGCLGVLSFIAITYTVWKGLEVAHSPIIAILPLWGVWLFAIIFDHVLPKYLGCTTNKWIIRGCFLLGLLFCLFVFYTCQKWINDNSTVYFNELGKHYHSKKDCDEISQEISILQSRRIEAERKGLHPCFCCDVDEEATRRNEELKNED